MYASVQLFAAFVALQAQYAPVVIATTTAIHAPPHRISGEKTPTYYLQNKNSK